MQRAHSQLRFGVRLDWGVDGAAAVAAPADVAVVVDVLSFSTAVSVAADAGITVLPFRWADERAVAYAHQQQAVLAVGRRDAGKGQISLSPASIRAARGVTRVVLPSPNGSTIAACLAAQSGHVLAGSLRNAEAVADWITREHGVDGCVVALVASGERWPNGGLRPAVEDLWGAGAVVSALQGSGWLTLSPEAEAAGAAFERVRRELKGQLLGCGSGSELVDQGFGDDVRIASELNASRTVPALGDDGFHDAAN